jgi:L-lactate permease
MSITAITNRLRKFNDDEAGIESLQVVMICAIAAIVLVAFAAVGDDIYGWCEDKVSELTDWSIG